MGKKILLVNPPPNDFRRVMSARYPSGALLLLGTMCQDAGHEVKVVDMVAECVGTSRLEGIVSSFRPEIVGVTVNTFQARHAKKVLETVKGVDPAILTVVGGPHPTALGAGLFEEFPFLDVSVIGEGEFTLLEIVAGRELSEIKGICRRGKVNHPRPLADNLDHIPLPCLDLVNIDNYTGDRLGGGRSMFVMASRGCPYNCIYCNKSVFGSRVRFRKPEKVIEEIKYLRDRHGITKIVFYDDALNLNRKWLKRLLGLIVRSGLNEGVSYFARFRANGHLADEEILRLAKDAGFKTIYYGVESGNQEMLDRMGKALTVSEIRDAFRLTRAAGIETFASFVIGLPGESVKTVEDTLALRRELNPSSSGFTIATPFPNTRFDVLVREKGHLIHANYEEYRFGGAYVRTDELSLEELELYRAIGILCQRYDWLNKLPVLVVANNAVVRRLSVLVLKANRFLRARPPGR